MDSDVTSSFIFITIYCWITRRERETDRREMEKNSENEKTCLIALSSDSLSLESCIEVFFQSHVSYTQSPCETCPQYVDVYIQRMLQIYKFLFKTSFL